MLLFLSSICLARSFGVPARGFRDDFEDGNLSDMHGLGFAISSDAVYGSKSLACKTEANASYTGAYLRSTSAGVEPGWRRISQGALSAVIIGDSASAVPGIGFVGPDGAAVYAQLNFSTQTMSICSRSSRGAATEIKSIQVTISHGDKSKLEILWSPFANACIASLYAKNGTSWDLKESLRALAYLPDARYPFVADFGGGSRFDDVTFDPNLDTWNYDWEFYTSPILVPERPAAYGTSATNFANGVHWKWKKDNKFYMRMRNGVTYSSADVLHWTRVGMSPVWCPSDPCLLMDPFGDGCVYISSRSFPWFKSDGRDGFVTWDLVAELGLNAHGLKGALQDIVDVKRFPGLLDLVSFEGTKYRFVGVGEYTFDPFSSVVLSNDLHTWVRPDAVNAIPARTKGRNWEETGDAIGCAYPMADGNILIISCTCTASGYTGGGFEATNVTAVLDGRQPWKTLKVSRLPMTPASASDWTRGPNMPNSFVYDEADDVLYFFSDFGDKAQGVLRVRNFSKP